MSLLYYIFTEPFAFIGRFDQVPPHRLHKYPSPSIQGPTGPPSTHMQGPPSHHQQPQPQPNFNNSYPNPVPQVQHQPNNYYGPQGTRKK